MYSDVFPPSILYFQKNIWLSFQRNLHAVPRSPTQYTHKFGTLCTEERLYAKMVSVAYSATNKIITLH